MCDTHPDIVDEGIDASDAYVAYLISKLKLTCQPNELSEPDAASLLMGKCSLSQRAYKNLKCILKSKNVKLPN